jgi:hypothetical protein
MPSDRIHFLVPKGLKGKYKRFARRVHKTDLTGWLRRLMEEDIAQHTPPATPAQ